MALAAANNACLYGRYTLLGKLGAGGHGEVWRARDHAQGIELALKILSPELARTPGAWEALQREYDIASRLEHPLILRIFRPEKDGGMLALPMELAPGGDLRRLRSVSYLEIGPVLLELAQALAYTHERGIVHRDLKPGNVLFDSRGHVKLADFGVAGTMLGGPAAPAEAARAGLSPFTASPEQLRGEPPAIADDIYGLGALAYELLSGYPPYYPHFELRRAIEEPAPQLRPAHQAPDRLIGLVMAMLSKRASLRPASMRQVIDSLDAALNDTLTFEQAAEIAPPPPPPAELAATEPPAVEISAAEFSAAEFSAAQFTAVEPAPVAAPPGESASLEPPPVELASAEPAAAERDPARRIAPEPARPGRAAVSGSARAGRVAGGPAQTRSAVPVRPIRSPRAEPIAPMQAGRPEPVRDPEPRELWADIAIEPMPGPVRREPERHARWPWVLIAGLAAAAALSFFWLPRWAAARSWLPSSLASLQQLVPQDVADAIERAVDAPLRAIESATDRTAHRSSPAAGASSAPDGVAESDIQAARAQFDARLAALDVRGAGVWGGRPYADAKAREAEAAGADEAGSPSLAAQKLAEAERLLGEVEHSAPGALAAQLASGEQALQAGNSAAARQAFELAHRIDPGDSRAAAGLERAQALDRALPLLVDGLNAETNRNYSRAAQDYQRMLALDPSNAKARAGLRRASAALGAEQYARAVGAGLDALGDGRLEAARQAFELAHRLDRNGREAQEGLDRVSAALRDRELAQLRTQATALEARQRWSEALQAYDAALRIDPSLSFAQQGKARVAAKAGATGLANADLASRLQALVDDPESLESPAVRAEAAALVREAGAVQPSSANLRALASRLSALAPEYDKTVHLALISDNATQVEIPEIGSFGTFARREIDLKPGKYTVIGTRAGYRDVRRSVTIEPGEETQTISVRCEEPI